MLYTIGHTDSYERYFKEQYPDIPRKLGTDIPSDEPGYGGGCIWLTQKAAQDYINKGNLQEYSVYGVDCTIEDTMHIEGESFRILLKTSPLIRLSPH